MNRPAAVLFDLGNVILDLDAGAVFDHWARHSGASAEALADRWTLDDAYKQHEVGELSFEAYAAHLGRRLGIELSLEDWRTGWNAVFRGVRAPVAERLATLAASLPCYGYTNTNPTHHVEWQTRYATALAPFRKIYISSEIGYRKPDVTSFRWVAEDIGQAPGEILFVDDTRDNVDGARRAGMRASYVADPDQVLKVMDALLC